MDNIIEQVIEEINNERDRLKIDVSNRIQDIYNAIYLPDTKKQEPSGCLFFWRKKTSKKSSSDEDVQSFQIMKNRTISNIIDVTKSISENWEIFIVPRKQQIQDFIEQQDIDESHKDRFRSKTYVHKIVEISLIDISSLVDMSTNVDTLKEKTIECKQLLTKAIEKVTSSQIEIYKTLVS